jgi:hypothetical protein
LGTTDLNGGALFNAEFGIRHRGSTVPERSGVALSFCRRQGSRTCSALILMSWLAYAAFESWSLIKFPTEGNMRKITSGPAMTRTHIDMWKTTPGYLIMRENESFFVRRSIT